MAPYSLNVNTWQKRIVSFVTRLFVSINFYRRMQYYAKMAVLFDIVIDGYNFKNIATVHNETTIL